MKSLKFLTMGLLALALVSSAHAAATTVRLSGAATYRSPLLKGIEDSLNSGYTFGYNGSARYKANASIYHGTLKSNGAEVIIETYFTGDLAGVVDLTKRNNITKWISTGTTSVNSLTTGGLVIANGYTGESAPPDASITVSFNTSSAAAVASGGSAGLAASKTILNTTLIDAGSAGKAGDAQVIGVAAFQWVLGKLASPFTAPFNNITFQSANNLIGGGSVPVSFFTGSVADINKWVFLVGRSEDAGARTVPFAEAQTGFGNSAYQYALTFSGSSTTQADGRATGGTGTTVTGFDLWPASAPLNTEPTIFWTQQGHSGYNLTSDLANVLSSTNPVLSGSFTGTIGNAPSFDQAYFVGYNGVADTAALVANGGTALSWNGVPYSVSAVQNGLYSLWSFAHLYYIGAGVNTLAGTQKKAVDDIADTIYQTDADVDTTGAHSATSGAGIFFDGNFKVTRSIEGGAVSLY